MYVEVRALRALTRFLTWGMRTRRNADIEYLVVYLGAFVVAGIWFFQAGYYWGVVLAVVAAAVVARALNRLRRKP
jgi:hypothetical protein